LSFATAFRRAARIIGFVGVGMCTFVWLARLSGPFPIHGDGVRDQMPVRDCVELGRCALAGAPTSIAGALPIYQGAAWLDLLTAVRLVGGDTTTQVTVVLALNALAAAVTFVVVWRWLRPAWALPAAYLLAMALAENPQSADLLANGSASPLFDVVMAAGLLCYAVSDRARYLLVAAFAAALAVNVHVVAVTLVPALLLVPAFGRKPVRDVVAAGAVFLAVYFVTSSAALEANVMALAARGSAFVVLPAVAAMVAFEAASRFGARFRRLSVNARAAIIGGVLILPFVLAVLWLVLIERHGFEPRYFHPIYGPVAVFQAAILCAPFDWLGGWQARLRWVPSIILLGSMMAKTWEPIPPPAMSPTWTLADATTVGDAAARAGWSFEDLVFRLQGSASEELLLGIAVEGPRLNDGPPADDRQLQVVLLDSEPPPAPDDYAVVPLEKGRFAAVRSVQSWLRPEGVEVCRRPMNETASPTCERLRVHVAGHWMPFGPESRAEARRHPGAFSFESRVMVTMGTIGMSPPYVTSYRIPVVPHGGEVRDVRLTDGGSAGCRWQFVRADGLRLENTLPATHVRLSAEDDHPGALVVEKPFGVPSCPAREIEISYPPSVLETRPGEPFERLVARNE
jgi:hypothetical protein